MKTTIPLMTELGFSAIQNGAMAEAENIFISLTEVAQDDASGFIGLATIKLSHGDVDTAIDYLESGLKTTTVNTHEARKLLLIAYMLQGNSDGAEALHGQFIADRGAESSADDVQRAAAFFGN